MHPAPSAPDTPIASRRVRVRNPWPGRTTTALVAIASMITLYASGQAYSVGQHFLRHTHTVDPVSVVIRQHTTRPAPTKFGAMNILLLGIDSRTGLSEEEIKRYRLGGVGLGGSDTIMLVHLSSQRDHATIISFPRDLLVTIPEFQRSDGKTVAEVRMKINAAFPRGGPDGPALTQTTIEQLTGLQIDHYMSIDVPHLGRMVTALKGIEVCLPKAINDPVRHTPSGTHGSGLVLPAGKHVLNDVQAVGYVRARYIDTGEGTSDFGRIRRQQKFLSSMLRKVTSSGTLFNMTLLRNFLNTLSDAVTMDTQMTPTDLFTIARQLQSLDPKHVTFVTVPAANDDYQVPGVGSTVLADKPAAQALYDALREDKQVGAGEFTSRPKTLKPSEVAVQVLNGGAPAGSAGLAKSQLAAMGFTSAGPTGNADNRNYTVTTIKYPGAQIAEASTVQQAVPGAKLVLDDTATAIQLILGKDFAGTTPIPTTTTVAKPVQTHSAGEDVCTKN